MYIYGFSVDSLGSFRVHFSLATLMDYWMQPVVFKKWMQALRSSVSLDEASLLYLERLEAAIADDTKIVRFSMNSPSMIGIYGLAENGGID